jgi:hypothetical protein
MIHADVLKQLRISRRFFPRRSTAILPPNYCTRTAFIGVSVSREEMRVELPYGPTEENYPVLCIDLHSDSFLYRTPTYRRSDESYVSKYEVSVGGGTLPLS